jgi:GCN5-related N-acetyl-transferase
MRLNDGLEFLEGKAMAAASVRDNKAQNRFELEVEGAVAFANYRLAPGAVIITHTETPRALRGRGIASQLVEGAAATNPRRWSKGGRRLRLRGGLPAQASGVCGSGEVRNTGVIPGRAPARTSDLQLHIGESRDSGSALSRASRNDKG